jgi:hypothetical protein
MSGYATYEVSYEKHGHRKRETYRQHRQTQKTYIQKYGDAVMKSISTDTKLNDGKDESEKICEIYRQNGCTNVTCHRVN